VLRKPDAEPAPMLFAFILSPMIEEFPRRTLPMSHGEPSVLFTRPLSAALLTAAALILIMVLLPSFRRTREVALQEEELDEHGFAPARKCLAAPISGLSC
jgi:putative tricarboxylic transport membrane protein